MSRRHPSSCSPDGRELKRGAPWAAVAVLIATAALWSLNGPLIKLLQAPDADFPPVSGLTIACYRSLLGGLVLAPFAFRRRRTLRATPMKWRVGAVVCFTVMTVSFVVATTNTAAANAILLQYTSPIWVFLLSPWLLGERPRLAEALALAVAMVGVVVIFVGDVSGASIWLIVGLVSGLGYGALTVTLRGLRAASPIAVAAMNALASGVILAAPVALWARFDMSPRQWGLMLLMAIVQFTVPYVFFSWALQRVKAHQAALIVLLEAVLNPLLTYLLAGEHTPGATLVGGPLILLGVAAWTLTRRSDAAAQDASGNAAPSP